MQAVQVVPTCIKENLPKELIRLPQWVLWKLEPRRGSKKLTKIPYNRHGNMASVTNPKDWSGFFDIMHEENNSLTGYMGTGYSGWGFVFTAGDPYVGIDLDHCVVNGKLTDEAKEIIMKLNSYTERSQSKTGVHIIVRAKLPDGGNRKGNIEMYDRERFFVMTGDHVKGTPLEIADRQEEVNELFERVRRMQGLVPVKTNPSRSAELSDQDILSIALKSRIGVRFGMLYGGDWSSYKSQSEADQSLCNLLAFYTKDPEQLDRLFRGSGLMRDKWEREDYRERTISKALETITAQYAPHDQVPLPDPPAVKPKSERQTKSAGTAREEMAAAREDDEDIVLDIPDEWDGKLGAAALHGLAGEVVRFVEPHTEADPAALLINFLTIFGNIIGTGAHFVVSGGQHRLKLFTVLVGATFRGKKGTSLEPIVKLFQAIDPDFNKRKKSGLSSGEGIIYSIRDPITERMPVMDGDGKRGKRTGEYEDVVVDPGIDDKRLLILESEFGSVLNVLRRDGSTLSAIVRNAWDGTGDIRTLTKNPLSATNTHVSIMGHITPEELRKLLTGNEIYNGFVNRFLWLYVQQSKSLPSGGEFHKVDVGPLVEKIRAAVQYATSKLPLDRQGNPLPMERNAEANNLWERIYEPLQRDASGIIGAATSRVIPYTMRIACIYALLDQSHTVGAVHLQAALAVWAYCYKSVRYIFGEHYIQGDPTVKRILNALKENHDGLSATDLFHLFQKNIAADQIKEAVKTMQEAGLITIRIVKGKGRPKQIIELNQTKEI